MLISPNTPEAECSFTCCCLQNRGFCVDIRKTGSLRLRNTHSHQAWQSSKKIFSMFVPVFANWPPQSLQIFFFFPPRVVRFERREDVSQESKSSRRLVQRCEMFTAQIRVETFLHWSENLEGIDSHLFWQREALSFQFMVLFLRSQEHNFKNRKHDGFLIKLNSKMKAIITQIYLAN